MPAFKMAFNGYSVQFSPFDDRVAVGAAQNFGIIGNGKQYILQVLMRCKLWIYLDPFPAGTERGASLVTKAQC